MAKQGGKGSYLAGNHSNDGKSEWSNSFGKWNEWSKKATKGLANKAVGKPQYGSVKSRTVD
jgi:hypothetical protein